MAVVELSVAMSFQSEKNCNTRVLKVKIYENAKKKQFFGNAFVREKSQEKLQERKQKNNSFEPLSVCRFIIATEQ